MSIREGIDPEELKLAKVIPIYKGEDDQLIQNYRPISENKVFYDSQFGFRKKHATSNAIITLTEKVSNVLDTGNIVVGVFLNNKKHLIQWIIIFLKIL